MKYKINTINKSEPIDVKDVNISGISIDFIDKDGLKFSFIMDIGELDINDKVLKELEQFEV